MAVLISVLMPVYNARRYVGEAVESVLGQTLGDFELVIIDDGSSDGSGEVLEGYARRDRRIRLVRRPNTGYGVALNEALALAQGTFAARMDADDVCLPERFAQQVAYLQAHPECVCVGGCYLLMDAAGRHLTQINPPLDDEEIQKQALAGHGSICHPSAMIRREALQRVGGYDPELCPAEDVDLWLKLGEVGKLANLSTPVLKYRLHSDSVSETAGARQRDKAKEACQRAWRRRGIQGTFEAGMPWRPGPDRASQQEFALRYGWWAFNSGQRRTALLYGLKAVGKLPLNREGWRLLVCAAVKPIKVRP